MMVRSITALNSFPVLGLAIGLMTHVIVLPSVLSVAGRSAWVSLMIAGSLYIIWIPLIYIIIKKTGQQNLMNWLKTNSPPIVYNAIRALILFLIFINVFVTLYTTFSWVNTNYMIQTPKYVLFIILIILCLLAALSGIKAITIASGILFPIVCLLGFFIMIANFKFKDYSLLFPIFEEGWAPILFGVVILSGGLLEIFLLVLLQHHIRDNISLKFFIPICIFFVFVNFGPLIGAITEFGPSQAAELTNPAYAQWRLITLGKFLNKLDFLSIYQWLSGAFIRISLSIFIIGDLFHFKTQKRKVILLISVCLFLIIGLSLPIDGPTYKIMIDHYFFSITVIGILLVTLSIHLILLIKGRVEKNENAIKQ
ncbi:endospore germination permease [Cytobacillus kochii]|uniref:Uncharacterized protein n=1 Tax=Cytobacillus kochii TaxID=859143 RepID=A0A248TEH5_9BACI|nr:endospore germination permease [Cytobacillus kochii]ASV66587.1 hypothetical protein CKF48_04180 [Cytobacillus kochii]